MDGVTVFAAEGARCGLMVCDECGAAILLDPRDEINRPDQHRKWHEDQALAPLGRL